MNHARPVATIRRTQRKPMAAVLEGVQFTGANPRELAAAINSSKDPRVAGLRAEAKGWEVRIYVHDPQPSICEVRG